MSKFYTFEKVRKRLPYWDAVTTPKPDNDDIETWLTEAEFDIESSIKAIGGVVPTDVARMDVIGSHSGDYAEARVRMAMAAAGGDGDNDDGKDVMERYLAWLLDLRTNRAYWGDYFQGAAQPIVASSQLRSEATSGENYTPEFDRRMKW